MSESPSILSFFNTGLSPEFSELTNRSGVLKFIEPVTPIRIFVDAHVFDGSYQGTRSFIKGIYTMLAEKEGVEIFLAASDIENLRNNFPVWPNILFIQYKTQSRYRRLLFEIPSIIRKYGFDYAHFQYIAPPVKNCKFIVTVHDVIFNDLPAEFSTRYRLAKHFLYKRSALKADLLTTVSEYSKSSIQKYFGISSENIHVVPNGINAAIFNNDGKEAAGERLRKKYGFEKFILYVSRIEPRKNHLVLLDAWLDLELYKKKIHLVFLGSRTIKTRSLYRKINRMSGEIRRFLFISDTIHDGELLDFYKAASLFVYPSGGEGFGIPPLEAAALEVPVICSNHAALRDYHFFDEDHINPFDLQLLKTRIKERMDHPADKSLLEERAQFVKRIYNWKLPAENLYQLLLNKHKCDTV
jgi:glycosyltransferase involved in cell wall biosynthesis